MTLHHVGSLTTRWRSCADVPARAEASDREDAMLVLGHRLIRVDGRMATERFGRRCRTVAPAGGTDFPRWPSAPPDPPRFAPRARAAPPGRSPCRWRPSRQRLGINPGNSAVSSSPWALEYRLIAGPRVPTVGATIPISLNNRVTSERNSAISFHGSQPRREIRFKTRMIPLSKTATHGKQVESFETGLLKLPPEKQWVPKRHCTGPTLFSQKPVMP